MLDRPVRALAVAAHDGRRALSSGTRDAFRAYRSAMALQRRFAGADPTTRAAQSLDSLRSAVRSAASLPFWADRFSSAGLDWTTAFSFDDFRRLPVLERAEIAAAGDALVSPTVSESSRRKMATGGSSGTPTVTWTGPLERGWIEAGIEHFESRLGVRRTHRRALLWGHNLDPVTRESTREKLEDWLWNRRWYDCFRLSPEILRAYYEDMTRFSPQVVLAYATALASLAEAVRDQDLPTPTFPSLGFITGAEKLYESQRSIIETVFRQPVFERYGGRDLGFIGMQQRGDPTHAFAVDWLNVYVEPEQDQEIDSILVSKLHADAMPLLRYRTGDVGRFGTGATGRPVHAIHEVMGRELQRVVRRDGGWMHGTVIPHLLKDFPFREYQLRQAADLSVELAYVPLQPLNTEQEAMIVKALGDNLPGLPLALRSVDAIPRTAAGKWLPVVSDAIVEPASSRRSPQ